VVLLAADATFWRRVADHADLRDAVLDALGSLSPATIEWGTGHCDVASNRDLDLDGRALVGFNPSRHADDTLLVGRLCGGDGAIMATIVNYACHPTTLAWQNRQLSPDYVGALREIVETATEAPCLFLQGASGELAPREQYTGDLSLADRHGTAIGHAALATLATMPSPATALRLVGVVESGAPLAMWHTIPADLSSQLTASITEIMLPLRALPTLSELETEWADIDPLSRDERLRRARHQRDGYIDLDNSPATVAHKIWTVQIGDAVIVAHPGEAYSAFQSELRRRFPERAIIVANLTNGPGFVYLPDAQAYRRNAYQAWQTPLAEGALEMLTEAAAAAIASATLR